MFIFTGKFDWLQYASNDDITFVVPGSIEANQPIWGFWQWTVTDHGVPKANATVRGTMTAVGDPSDDGSRAIEISFGYYTFHGTVGTNNANLKVTMRNPSGAQSGPWTLPLFYSDQSTEISARAFVGKLDWYEYAQNEMVTLVLPVGVGKSAPASLFFQWTEDAAGTKKAPYAISTFLREYTVEDDGSVKATFREYKESGELGYYSFSVEVAESGEVAMLGMKNPAEESDLRSPYKLSLFASPANAGTK